MLVFRQTHASVYMMLRGSNVVFTAVLSRVFLGRKLPPAKIVGMVRTLGVGHRVCVCKCGCLPVTSSQLEPAHCFAYVLRDGSSS
jgi:hypothetical protein